MPKYDGLASLGTRAQVFAGRSSAIGRLSVRLKLAL
jgi:hypothetical protein